MAQHFITSTEQNYRIQTEKSHTTRVSNLETTFSGWFNANTRDMILTQPGSKNEARFTSYDDYQLDNLVINDIDRVYLERSGGNIGAMHLHHVKNMMISNYNNGHSLVIDTVHSNTLAGLRVTKESAILGMLDTPALRGLQLEMNSEDQLPIISGNTNLFVMDKMTGPNYMRPSQSPCEYIFAVFKTRMTEPKLLSYWKENGQDKFTQTHNGNFMLLKTFSDPFGSVLRADDNEQKIVDFMNKVETLKL